MHWSTRSFVLFQGVVGGCMEMKKMPRSSLCDELRELWVVGKVYFF